MTRGPGQDRTEGKLTTPARNGVVMRHIADGRGPTVIGAQQLFSTCRSCTCSPECYIGGSCGDRYL